MGFVRRARQEWRMQDEDSGKLQLAHEIAQCPGADELPIGVERAVGIENDVELGITIPFDQGLGSIIAFEQIAQVRIFPWRTARKEKVMPSRPMARGVELRQHGGGDPDTRPV
ncbi:hypothetical protein TZ53_12365 [Sphingobium sp. YBL2]|nr:hypothetical protein TZ53_12365 [Sphingobium sp. YBL2]